MQSSYNVIKSNYASTGKEKKVTTIYNNETENEEGKEPQGVYLDDVLSKYESLGSNILKRAKEERETIINEAIVNANSIEKRAYEKGYEQSLKNGYEDGFNKGMIEAKESYEAKAKELIAQAEYILKTAKDDYDIYMKEKREEIINFSLEIAKIITKREVIELGGITDLIEKVLENAKGEENIVIRVNPVHGDVIREKSDYWKITYGIKEEIFILEDSFMDEGNALIEKTTGKTEIGIDVGFTKIEDYLKERIKK